MLSIEKNTGTHFRLFLQNELIRRCKENPRYSLRAFSRTLQTEPSFLSKLLNQKRSITETTLLKFGKQLGLNPLEIENFKTKLKIRSQKKEEPNGESMTFHQLALDQFQMISDWYHYAILELITVQRFTPSFPWISKTLNISITEAKAAVERLIRLGFLKTSSRGKWVNLSGNNSTLGKDFTTAALRKLQKQILEKAIHALEEIPLKKRNQTSMTLAIDSRLLPGAKRRIQEFQRKLTQFLQERKKRDEVFHLSISLYPVTSLNTKERKLS